MKQFRALRPGVLLLALAIAFFLWGVAHGSSSIELVFDVPVELHNMPEDLVVTDQTVQSINLRVKGSRAALGNVNPGKLSYSVDLSGGQPGIADYDVQVSRIELPRGAQPSAHSPSHFQVRFEERGRKVVAVRADLTGELDEGYRLADVNVVPPRVRLEGARSFVLRLDEVATEPIDLAGLTENLEREVPIRLPGGTVWMEDDKPVKVLLQIVPELVPEDGAGVDEEAGERESG